MTVGRKGHRAEEEDDDLSEHSDSSALSTIPPISEVPTYRGAMDRRQSVSADNSPNQNQLPNFQAFLRGISPHQRSTSMPGFVLGNELPSTSRELHTQPSTRATRTLSGTMIREYRAIDAHSDAPRQAPATSSISRPPLLPHQSLPLYTSAAAASSQHQTSRYSYQH